MTVAYISYIAASSHWLKEAG